MIRGPFWLGDESRLPPPELADEQGLLAVGGELSTERLLEAYGSGIFPWPLGSEGSPMLWFSPDPRFLLYPQDLHVSRSLARSLKDERFELRADTAFEEVMHGCATVARPGQDGTWLSAEMLAAYAELHRLGFAHSVESFLAGELVGGIYGVALGAAFFAESMFHLADDASKVALVGLVRTLGSRGYRFVDCQQETDHLARFGARPVSRSAFLRQLDAALSERGGFPEPGPLDSGPGRGAG